MTRRISSFGMAWTGLALMALTMFVPAASAQYVDSPECLKQTYDALAHEKRLYRSVLFGQKAAADLPIGSVLFDIEGNTWLKKEVSQWRSLADGYTGTTWSDTLMDQRVDVPPRRGIFETRKAPTSDLIPAITQSFRAYQCRLAAVCATALKSQTTDATTDPTVTVQPDGCIELQANTMKACKSGTQDDVGANTCPEVVQTMLDQEVQLLILVTAYDASYRTLMQFEGVFEGFLSDFRFPLIDPLWQTVRAMGGLARTPCFSGQCDE